MKQVIFGMLLLSASSALASADQFAGTYRLTSSQVEGDTFCYDSFTIEVNGNEASFNRDGYMIYSGEVNGPKRKVSYSHGEALSSTKGYEQVTLEKGVLSFQFKGTSSFVGVPATREESTISMKLSQDGSKLTLLRKEFEGVAFGLGKKAAASCQYTR
nr:hypothetical protein CKG001_27680 [Bdellovibrio sp. CKG001]BFD64075.1 hypothetical protein BdHM001_27560 [Bdellovibrio sp. HM001]BFD68266.1 hypothetical protein HAGR004_32880 [Bdellovibrio sp. HAGR004]